MWNLIAERIAVALPIVYMWSYSKRVIKADIYA